MKELTKKQLEYLEENRETFIERHGELAYRRAIASGRMPPEILKGFQAAVKDRK